ncbi:MAG: methylmalonyl-CoA mutase family protein [Dehalococcoidia bacterium]|nr:methylmalonyl-CoA mutase family protein [Dehalococcoidia bacterium]
MEKLERIRAAREKWERECLLKKPFAKAQTDSGIQLKPVYAPEDIEGIDYLEDIGFPGEPPYTRGVFPSMYRGRLWTIRQYAGLGSAEETNRRFKYLLQQGQTGLSVAFDLPTQIGIDSDDPRAEGEIGRVGVVVDTLADMEALFDGIALDTVSVSMTINPTASIILAMYIAVGEKQGVPQERLRAIPQNDILKEFISRGTQIFPVRPSLKLAVDVIEYCSQHLPKSDPISICGYHMREAGANAIQEVAYCLSDAVCYVEEVTKRGMPVDDFAPKLSFLIECGLDLFEEVAKFRAARKLWSKIAKERFHAENPASMMFRVFSGCEASKWTVKEPLNNIIRGTICALSGVLGGTNALHITSYDECYATPSEESARISLRTQQIIAEETSIAKVADPLGGSYYVEWLTKKMEDEIAKEMASIERRGGMLALVENGAIQKTIALQARERQKKFDSGQTTVVGVNKYLIEEEPREFRLQRYDPETVRMQIEKLNEVKRRRDSRRVSLCLGQIKAAAASGENVMPLMIAAVKEYATCGEIVNALRGVYGEYREAVNL